MNEPPDLGRMIACCGHLGMQYTNRQLREAGCDVTPVQCHLLMALSFCGGQAATQRELEHELHLRPSRVNGIVNRLAEKGYVARRPSPEDGRCRRVCLTESGQAQAAALRAALDETNRRFTAILTEAEQAQMQALLGRIIANLENEVNNA